MLRGLTTSCSSTTQSLWWHIVDVLHKYFLMTETVNVLWDWACVIRCTIGRNGSRKPVRRILIVPEKVSQGGSSVILLPVQTKWKQQVTQKESSLMGYKLHFPWMWSQLIKLFCTAAMKDATALEPSPAFPSAGIKYPKPLRDFACFVYMWAVSPSNNMFLQFMSSCVTIEKNS